ncbi:MAG: cleavage protein [Peptococcaceae bacterium]|nr:cleavage protein [Peptococcaceae bacterium]
MTNKQCQQCFFSIDGCCRLEQSVNPRREGCQHFEHALAISSGGTAL